MIIPYLLTFIGLAGARFGTQDSCRKVDWIDIGIYFAYSNGPIFHNLLPDTEENRQLDSVCLTYFPAVDNPDMYLGFESRVYCDGSNIVTTFMVMQISFGVQRIATPFYTLTDHTFAFDGCETYFLYRCSNWGDEFEPFVYGASFDYQPVPLAYLRNMKDIVEGQGLPEQDFYIVPMSLPHRCVIEPVCVPPPNPFFNQLPKLPFRPAETFLEELPVIPLTPPDTFFNEITVLPLRPPEPLFNEIPVLPFPPPEPFFNEIPVLPFPLAETLFDDMSIPNIPFPLPDPLFDDLPFVPLPERFVSDLPGIPIPIPGPLFDDIPPLIPDPLLNDFPGLIPKHPPPGPLFKDMANPFFNKVPGLGLPPPKPLFNSVPGRPRPPPHPIFNELPSINLL